MVFVPASERSDYERAGVANVVPVPVAIRGITRTRNWILDWAQQAGERWVVFVDDDLASAGYVELMSDCVRNRKISAEEWHGEFLRLFEVMQGCGYRIWGVATQAATRSIYPYRPFLFRSYVTASCMGMVSSLRFDESFPVKEDYELCLRCIREDGGILAARYLFWQNSHWGDKGGCATYRTRDMELAAIHRLMRMYPGMISRVKRGGSEFSIDLEFPGRG